MDYTYDREERAEMLILIVEDEAAIASFLGRGLNAHGHRVVYAYEGEEGTRLARRREDRTLQQGIRPAGVLYAPQLAGPLQAADPLRHLEQRFRTSLQRRRRLRATPSYKVDPPGGPSLIQTVRGAGYRFNPTP